MIQGNVGVSMLKGIWMGGILLGFVESAFATEQVCKNKTYGNFTVQNIDGYQIAFKKVMGNPEGGLLLMFNAKIPAGTCNRPTPNNQVILIGWLDNGKDGPPLDGTALRIELKTTLFPGCDGTTQFIGVGGITEFNPLLFFLRSVITQGGVDQVPSVSDVIQEGFCEDLPRLATKDKPGFVTEEGGSQGPIKSSALGSVRYDAWQLVLNQSGRNGPPRRP